MRISYVGWITGLIIWLIGVINLLTESPDPPSRIPVRKLGIVHKHFSRGGGDSIGISTPG